MAFDPPGAVDRPLAFTAKWTGSMYNPQTRRWEKVFERWDDAVSLADVIEAGERGAQPGG